jgi:hypothetical protein
VSDGGPTAGAAVQAGGHAGGALADDFVKLVAYFVVSLKPNHERLMPKGADTIVVTGNWTDEEFTTYVIAKYFQSTGYTELRPEEQARVRAERKYMRVHFGVVRRWPKEPRKYDERQIEVLDAIGRKLAGRGRPRP